MMRESLGGGCPRTSSGHRLSRCSSTLHLTTWSNSSGRFSLYTKRFDFEDSVEGRKHLIMLRHSLGLKWSAYYGGMLSDILEKGLRIKIEQTSVPRPAQQIRTLAASEEFVIASESIVVGQRGYRIAQGGPVGRVNVF